MLNLTRPLVVFDLETTGINITADRIVEISLLKIHVDGLQEWKTMRLNPTIPIPALVTAVHGISDADVKDCPTFADVARELFDFMNHADIAGYNSNYFDVPLITEEFSRCNLDFASVKRHFIDAFRIFQKMEKRDLSSAYRYYCGKTLENAHSAQADVQATYEVLLGQLGMYPEQLQPNVAFLHNFSTDNTFVDSGRKMQKNEAGDIVFTFGKYKGQLVIDVLKREPQYYDWMMKSDFAQDTKQKLTEIWLSTRFKTNEKKN
ncbi:MAG: 3'-5' exonuclease [Sphingobacteriales bacterium]|nr:3'-5' exonuclease [Sphingobacteriales bacterium]